MLQQLPATPSSGHIMSTSPSMVVPSVDRTKDDLCEKDMASASIAVTSLPLPASQESLTKNNLDLSPQSGGHVHMWLRYCFFTKYRRLFSLVFAGNLTAIFVVFAYRRSLETLRLSDLVTATASNVTLALLMRQDYIINLLSLVACAVPTWTPLFIERNCAKVFHIGGIHSNAGVAAALWFIALAVAVTVGLVSPDMFTLGRNEVAITLIVYVIFLLFIFMLITAYPSFRLRRHDIFEKTHRFAVWMILILFWILTVLSVDASRGSTSLSQALVKDPTFSLLIISTSSVVLPCLCAKFPCAPKFSLPKPFGCISATQIRTLAPPSAFPNGL